MGHYVIRPVERDCICPKRPADTHTKTCDDAYRAKFFGTWNNVRERFYGKDF